MRGAAMKPVTPRRIHLALRIRNAATAARACREAGLPFYVACALLEKESGGRNIYGHDAGGVFTRPSWLPAKRVTRRNWLVFRHRVIDLGEQSNGIGPCQITSRGLLEEMERQGLKPWVVYDNMLFGFRLLASYHRPGDDWVAAGTRYNGSRAYGLDLDRVAGVWHRRLRIPG